MNITTPATNAPSPYRYRVDSTSPFSNAKPQSFCRTIEQAERLKAEHQAHLPGCETVITEIGAPVMPSLEDGHLHWAVISLYRRSNCKAFVDEITGQICDVVEV